MKPCEVCKGKGEIPSYNQNGEGIYKVCNKCSGSGNYTVTKGEDNGIHIPKKHHS
jgi:DnaJ-class molecular chaperone